MILSCCSEAWLFRSAPWWRFCRSRLWSAAEDVGAAFRHSVGEMLKGGVLANMAPPLLLIVLSLAAVAPPYDIFSYTFSLKSAVSFCVRTPKSAFVMGY